jgi:DNA-binding transcriptional ArsR family regulator
LPPKRSSKTGKSSKKSGKRSQIDLGLVKALTHELRVEILVILGERTASPKELSDALDEGLSQVSYHVKVLREYECIELVDTKPRRGAVEHYYRATSRGRAALTLMDIEVPGSSKSKGKGKK